MKLTFYKVNLKMTLSQVNNTKNELNIDLKLKLCYSKLR
ncbi:hypothetical protein CLOSBL3_12446 [Clostridiaceae bacterium BL-3]|nr:hypothetical protein CLOSBL3_12446 [Clostridiaceae bacterium BL-3]